MQYQQIAEYTMYKNVVLTTYRSYNVTYTNFKQFKRRSLICVKNEDRTQPACHTKAIGIGVLSDWNEVLAVQICHLVPIFPLQFLPPFN